jgi:hypothetical protein
MKRIQLTFLMAFMLLGAGCTTVHSQPGVAGPEGGYFYDDLAPYGSWVWSDTYDWVWCPDNVPAGWRPYTLGYWVYADCGWTWVSDEPWGWACYHYGRWYFDPVYGWCWVPDTVWGPAWVAWNWGDDWCGWAPLPPLVAWEGEIDWDTVIPHHCWNFVDRRRFCDRHVERFLAPVARNGTLLEQTRNVTRFAWKQNRVVNLSLPPAEVEKAIHRPVPRVRLVDVNSAREWRAEGARVRRDQLAMFRPNLGRLNPRERPPQILRGAPPSSTPPERWLRQQEQQHRRLEEYQRRESARLQQFHERELQHPPPGLSPWDLGQRHLAERRAQEEEFHRQNQVFEHQFERGLSRGESRPPPAEYFRAGPSPSQPGHPFGGRR